MRKVYAISGVVCDELDMPASVADDPLEEECDSEGIVSQ
jgi:hypothetical protein